MTAENTNPQPMIPKDLDEALAVVFNNYMASIKWLIQVLEISNAPYKITDEYWYADQILNGFKQRIVTLKQQLQEVQQKQKELDDAHSKSLQPTPEVQDVVPPAQE
jgi:hypothetical protein